MFPIIRSYFVGKKRDTAPLIEVFKNENIDITPATTLYIPKSSTPKVFNTTLEVYKDITIENNMRIYK